ncbi:MAG: gfo/Idh/MocA family oxidoreductase, partial [Chloroflexi bacterium]
MSVWRTAINALNLQTTPPLPENPRPIVVIGAGGIVNDAHLPAYRQAGFAVTGIFDLDEEQARKTAVSFNIPSIYPALETAVAESPTNAVFDVAVPAAALPKILPLLPNGAGVLIQKPMGASLAEARSILELCQQKELKAAVNFQLRYAPFVLAAHSLIEQGVIGELLDVEVRVNVFTPWHLWEYLEGVAYAELYYHSIHYLDYIRYCLGNPRGVF